VMAQETFAVFSQLSFLRKMYRNDISTFHRKVFNILIFLSKQHVLLSPSRRFTKSFFTRLCVMFASYVLYPAAQFKQIAQLFPFFSALRSNYNFYSNFNHIFVENRKKEEE
jgi:hypothetical protein